MGASHSGYESEPLTTTSRTIPLSITLRPGYFRYDNYGKRREVWAIQYDKNKDLETFNYMSRVAELTFRPYVRWDSSLAGKELNESETIFLILGRFRSDEERLEFQELVNSGTVEIMARVGWAAPSALICDRFKWKNPTFGKPLPEPSRAATLCFHGVKFKQSLVPSKIYPFIDSRKTAEFPFVPQSR